MFRNLIVTLLATFSLHALAADLNRASQAELEQVRGIGPALSTKIVQARESAPFKDWSDFVDRVQGIGPGSAAKMSAAGLTLGGQAYAAAEAPKPAKEAAKPRRGERAQKEPR